MLMVLHLLALNDIFHVFSQSSRLFKSSWRRLHSALEDTFRYNTQTSANRQTLESRAALGRSLMKDRNRCGPSTVLVVHQNPHAPNWKICHNYSLKSVREECLYPRVCSSSKPILPQLPHKSLVRYLVERLRKIQHGYVDLGFFF